MADTREEVLSILTGRLLTKHRSEATWSEIIAAVQNQLDAQGRVTFADAIRQGNYQDAGELIGAALEAELLTNATAEATAMLADDNLTLTNLLRVF